MKTRLEYAQSRCATTRQHTGAICTLRLFFVVIVCRLYQFFKIHLLRTDTRLQDGLYISWWKKYAALITRLYIWFLRILFLCFH